MARYLLDANILSDLIRHPQGRIAEAIARVGGSEVCTSIIVLSELRYGIARVRSRRLAQQLAMILTRIEVLAFGAPADSIYADVRTHLQRAGTPIGGNDLFIAAHTLALNLVLVTANEREFTRVPGLQVENWLR